MEWVEKNKYSLGLLVSIVLAGVGLYRVEQFDADLMGGGLGLMGIGSLGAVVFGILAKRKEKGSTAARLGTGFGMGMGILAIVIALAIVAFMGWIFLAFGLG